jgi:pantoate--beta-alanine ligase
MEVFTSISSLRTFLQENRHKGKSIGLVPTMGALHRGHISLLDNANAENDISVCSIFVNPTQFNNPEDLAKYPRTLEADLALLTEAGCSVVFAPTAEEMYPEPPVITFNFGKLESVMEGASRPGHFSGVGIVVSKLFNIVQPDRAYFGQKDLQQVSVIKRLVTDLSFHLDLVICPTVRETSGLAMSSRNQRLSEDEKVSASHIFRILSVAKEKILNGANIELARKEAVAEFTQLPEFTLDYLEVVDLNTLLPLSNIKSDGTNAICVATFLGPVRLIDNLIF